MIPRVLSIAGVDPCGGAGLGLDARVIQVCGGFAATVPTCTTVQSRHGFLRADAVDGAVLRAMLDAVASDGPIAAVKVGLCADARSVDVIVAWLDTLRSAVPHLVVDPVLSATAGGGPTGVEQIASAIVRGLVPHGAIVTPNLPEALALTGDGDVASLIGAGARAVVLKGGHGSGADLVDRLFERSTVVEFRHPRIDRGPVHGTGCALSSALATALARGVPLEVAVARAIGSVQTWISDTPDAVLPTPIVIR